MLQIVAMTIFCISIVEDTRHRSVAMPLSYAAATLAVHMLCIAAPDRANALVSQYIRIAPPLGPLVS